MNEFGSFGLTSRLALVATVHQQTEKQTLKILNVA